MTPKVLWTDVITSVYSTQRLALHSTDHYYFDGPDSKCDSTYYLGKEIPGQSPNGPPRNSSSWGSREYRVKRDVTPFIILWVKLNFRLIRTVTLTSHFRIYAGVLEQNCFTKKKRLGKIVKKGRSTKMDDGNQQNSQRRRVLYILHPSPGTP